MTTDPNPRTPETEPETVHPVTPAERDDVGEAPKPLSELSEREQIAKITGETQREHFYGL